MKEKKNSIVCINIFVLILLCMCVTACRRQQPRDAELKAESSEFGVIKKGENVRPALSPPLFSSELRSLMQVRVGVFMDSASPTERAPLAAQIYREMEQGLAGHASTEIDMMLASLAGGLVACDGDQGHQVAVALLTVAAPQRRKIILAAIAAVQTEAHTDQLIEAAAQLFHSKDADNVKTIIEHPSDYLDPPVLKSVTQSAAGFLLLKKARAAGETSLFADRDGGKKPASRSESSSAAKEEL